MGKKQGNRKIKISDDSSVKMEHLWMDLEKEEQPEFLKPKLITQVDCNFAF